MRGCRPSRGVHAASDAPAAATRPRRTTSRRVGRGVPGTAAASHARPRHLCADPGCAVRRPVATGRNAAARAGRLCGHHNRSTQQNRHNRTPTTAQHRTARLAGDPSGARRRTMSARPPARRAPAQGRRLARQGPGRPDPARRDAGAGAALLGPVVAATGLDLEDVELRTVGRRLVVRVLVDTETGVSLDQVATASHAVSEALDDAEPLGDEPYTLEVSSPGVDRPLTLPRHWRRNVGRLVAVTSSTGREVTGRVLSVDDERGRARDRHQGPQVPAHRRAADVAGPSCRSSSPASRTPSSTRPTTTSTDDDAEADDAAPDDATRRRRRDGDLTMDIDVSALKALVREKDLSYDLVVEHARAGAARSPTTTPRAPATARAGRARPQDRSRDGLGARARRRRRPRPRVRRHARTASAASPPPRPARSSSSACARPRTT